MTDTIFTLMLAAALSLSGCAAEYSQTLSDTEDGLCASAEYAKGDVLAISIDESYLDCTVKYGNVILLEEESTSKTLYFQGISPGKDNIVISELGSEGVILTEYIVIIDDDMTVTVYSSSLPNPIR